MKKAFIIIAAVGVALLIIGGAIFAAMMSKNNWDFTIFNNVDVETKTYSVEAEKVNGISVEAGTTKISYVETEGDLITVDYFTVLTKKDKKVVTEFSLSLENGVLKLKEKTERTFMLIDNDLHTEIVVRIPAGKELSVSLKTSTGKIAFGESGKEKYVSSLSLQTSTGRLEIAGKVTCAGNADCKVTTGNLQCDGELIAENVTMESSTGNIHITAPIKSKSLRLTAGTGNIHASGIDADSITAKCSTGNIYLAAKGKKEDYSFDYKLSTGNSNLYPYSAGAKTIFMESSTGNIYLSFSE